MTSQNIRLLWKVNIKRKRRDISEYTTIVVYLSSKYTIKIRMRTDLRYLNP